jgi:hypothetical protein
MVCSARGRESRQGTPRPHNAAEDGGAARPGSLGQAGISLRRLGSSGLLALRVQGISKNTHQYTAHPPEQ